MPRHATIQDYVNLRALREFGNDLGTATASIGSSEAILVVDQHTNISASIVIPDNITLRIPQGGKIGVDQDFILTISGTLDIRPHMSAAFSGSGKVNYYGGDRRIHPEWFGAVGDGATDITTEFQTTINNLFSGSTLTLKRDSVYMIDTAVFPSQSISFTIEGNNATFRKFDPTDARNVIRIQDAKNLIVRDFTIDCQATAVHSCGALYLRGVRNARIDNITTWYGHDNASGIGVNSWSGSEEGTVLSKNIYITNCYVYEPQYTNPNWIAGIQISNRSDNIVLENCVISSSAQATAGAGLDFDNNLKGSIINCKIINQFRAMVLEDSGGSRGYRQEIDISNCHLDLNRDGIHIHEFWGSIIINNTLFKNSTRHACTFFNTNVDRTSRIEEIMINNCLFYNNMANSSIDMSSNVNTSGQIKFSTGGDTRKSLLINNSVFRTNNKSNVDFCHILYGSGILMVRGCVFEGGQTAIRSYNTDQGGSGYVPEIYQPFPVLQQQSYIGSDNIFNTIGPRPLSGSTLLHNYDGAERVRVTPPHEDIATTQAGQSGAEVTIAGGAFNFSETASDSDLNKYIYWDSGEKAKILHISSSTRVRVDRIQTVASGTFELGREPMRVKPETISYFDVNYTAGTDSGATQCGASGLTASADGAFFSAGDVGKKIMWDSGQSVTIRSFVNDTTVGIDVPITVPTGTFSLAVEKSLFEITTPNESPAQWELSAGGLYGVIEGVAVAAGHTYTGLNPGAKSFRQPFVMATSYPSGSISASFGVPSFFSMASSSLEVIDVTLDERGINNLIFSGTELAHNKYRFSIFAGPRDNVGSAVGITGKVTLISQYLALPLVSASIR